MKAVGLIDKDTHFYFISSEFIIMDDPYDGNTPTFVKRYKGEPTEEEWKKIKSALALVEMELIGEAFTRSDGLWCHRVKEVSR